MLEKNLKKHFTKLQANFNGRAHVRTVTHNKHMHM